MRHASTQALYLSHLLAATALLTLACSETTTPPSATKLAFTIQPTTTTAGSPITPAVAVAIQDDAGNTVTTSTANITLATGSNTPGMTLAGTTTVAAVNGVATFTGLSINVASNYTLSATSSNLASATSAQFAVVAGAAAKLGFAVQPVNTLANAQIPTLTIAVQDAFGNTVASSGRNVVIGIGRNPGNASLSGSTQSPTVNGLAVFNSLSITKPGDGYTLTASTSGLTSGVSSAFNVTIGPASRLEFTIQPATSPPGSTISPAVAVTVKDVAGNPVLNANTIITLAIGTNPGAGTLSGHTALAPESGVSMFSDLSINNVGDGYTLTATAPNLAAAISTTFSIRNPLVFTTVSAGYFHTCGLTTGGAAYCWGQNAEGPTKSFPSSAAPMPLTGGFTFANLGAGREHTCGVTNDGAGRCWGGHDNGKLGGGAAQSGPPVLVSGGLTFATATAGYVHSCGVTTAGAGYCWGENSLGTLGNGTQTQSDVPVPVSGGLTFATVSPGRYITCGLTTGGKAYCWGDNTSGAVGDGTEIRRNIPVAVASQLSFATLIAGGFHSCGLTTGGLAYCWGSNQYGQLGGTGSFGLPVAVSGGHTFTMLTVGNRHNCGLTAAGIAYCWGDNSSGALGDGTNLSSSIPVAVSGGLTFTSISAGRFHTCGVATGGAAYCWGENSVGELGDGTTTSRLVPVPVR
jgi:alpha-tubulin suppressor-like RCC1 family protein